MSEEELKNVDMRHDEKLPRVVSEFTAAEHALHELDQGLMTNQQVRDEAFPIFSRGGFRCVLACAAGYFATCLYGYDAGVLSGINVMPQYHKYFSASSLGGATGLVFALYYAGSFVSAVTGPFLADRYGRRCPLVVGAIFALIGAIIQVTSRHIEQFRAARFILGYGSSLAFSQGPVYAIELAYPLWRGKLGGLLMIGVLGCNTFSLWMDFACSYAPTSFAWRFPLGFQVVPPTLLLLACYWAPESPRWLVANNRPEEALEVLVRYHGNGNPHSKLVALEFAEIQQAVSTTGADKRWWDFKPLFNSRASLVRTFCVVNYAVLVQWSGNSLGIYYLPVLIGQSGVTNFHTQLLVTACISLGALFLALLGTSLLDRVGRKNFLLFALLSMPICLGILAGIQSPVRKTHSETHAGIAIIILFRWCYALGMTPGEQVYGVEMLPHAVRAKGWAFASLCATAGLFASTYASPVALKNLGYRYYYVFIGLDLMWFLVVLFVYPETAGRTVEEMETIFQAKNPVKASRLATREAKAAAAGRYAA